MDLLKFFMKIILSFFLCIINSFIQFVFLGLFLVHYTKSDNFITKILYFYILASFFISLFFILFIIIEYIFIFRAKEIIYQNIFLQICRRKFIFLIYPLISIFLFIFIFFASYHYSSGSLTMSLQKEVFLSFLYILVFFFPLLILFNKVFIKMKGNKLKIIILNFSLYLFITLFFSLFYFFFFEVT